MTIGSPEKNKSQAVPIILTGMHRSGLSPLAAMLASTAGEENSGGAFAGAEFVALQTEMLKQAGIHALGWTLNAPPAVSTELQAKALALLSRHEGGVWGWKDPRSTLYLDFWHEMAPGARFVFVYRTPWEVADSLYRGGVNAEVLAADPQAAFTHWAHYNRLVLKFVQAHPTLCALISVDALAGDGAGVVECLNERFQLQMAQPRQEVYDARLMLRDVAGSRWPALVARLFPECMEVFAQLERAADRPGLPTGVRAADDGAIAQLLGEEWFAQHGMKRDIQIAAERAAMLKEQGEAKAKHAGELEKHASNLMARLSTLEEHAANQAELVEPLRKEKDILSGQIRDAKAGVAGLESSLAEARAHAQGLQVQLEDARKRVAELHQHADNLTKALAEKTAHAAGLEQQRAETLRQLEALRRQLAEQNRAVEDSRNYAAGLQLRLTEKTNHADGLERLRAEAQRRGDEFKKHSENLEPMLAESQKHASGLEILLTDSRKHGVGLESLLAESRKHAGGLEGMLAESQKHGGNLEVMLAESQKSEASLTAALAESRSTSDRLQAELVDAKRAWTMIKRLLAAPFGGRRK